MVAVGLLIIASAGVVSLQKVATFGNMRAKQLAVANQIGMTWMDRIRTDATVWFPVKGAPDNLPNTLWLKQINAVPNQWFRPTDSATRGTAGFDSAGNDVTSANMANAVYCTHLRLNWIYPPKQNDASAPQLIRADVRVFWLRERGLGPVGDRPVCDSQTVADALLDASALKPLARYHAIYFTSSVQRNAVGL